MATNRRTSNGIVLSFHDSLLRQSDTRLLMGPYWLNDNIISFYLEYLANVTFKDHSQLLFVSPEVTQCIKMVSDADEISIFLSPLNVNQKQYVFFPINNNERDAAGGSHWSLLVFSRPERAFFHFDSAKGLNFDTAQLFSYKTMATLNCANGQLTSAKCLQQTNGYDCGVHVLCMIEMVAQHIVLGNPLDSVGVLQSDDVLTKRVEILDLIEDLGGKIETRSSVFDL